MRLKIKKTIAALGLVGILGMSEGCETFQKIPQEPGLTANLPRDITAPKGYKLVENNDTVNIVRATGNYGRAIKFWKYD